MMTRPASVIAAAEVYAALCSNALLRMDKPATEYRADAERLSEELAAGIAAELADLAVVSIDSQTREPYVIMHPHHSATVAKIMESFGFKFIDMAPASVRVIVTPTTYRLCVDTFSAGRQTFTRERVGE